MKYFKVGQTVYHQSYGDGEVVSITNTKDFPIMVKFLTKSASFTEDGRELFNQPISLSQTPIPPIVNKPLTDEYVPFTFENLLIGTIVKNKSTGSYYLITSQSEGGLWVANTAIAYKKLFDEYTSLDGSPCGKLA